MKKKIRDTYSSTDSWQVLMVGSTLPFMVRFPHNRKSCIACSTELFVSVCPINLIKSLQEIWTHLVCFHNTATKSSPADITSRRRPARNHALSTGPARERHELSCSWQPECKKYSKLEVFKSSNITWCPPMAASSSKKTASSLLESLGGQ